jgi:MarR family transcriptional regulator, transcriptional regulator for hemolysin
MNDPRREAALRIVETSRLLRSLVEQRLKPYGMTRVQYATLAKLEHHNGLVQTDLAEMLDIQPIAVVRLIDQLSAEGLIERRQDAHDRRCNRLAITDGGRAKLAELSGFKESLGQEVFEGIEEADLRQMLVTLNALHTNIKAIAAAEHDAAKPKKVRSA